MATTIIQLLMLPNGRSLVTELAVRPVRHASTLFMEEIIFVEHARRTSIVYVQLSVS